MTSSGTMPGVNPVLAAFTDELFKLSAEFAPGIPESRRIHALPRVDKPETWTLAVQRHKAERAGEHIDLRLVSPDGRAHSWAMPKARFPKPGDKPVLVVPQPTHSAEYALTAGVGKPFVIESGYGRGVVTMDFTAPVEVHHSDPEATTRLRFNMYEAGGPQEFAIVRAGDKTLLVNKTKTRTGMSHLPMGAEKKPKMRILDPGKVDFGRGDEAMMPKYDGAHTLLDLHKSGDPARVFSYRIPKRAMSGLIEHTHKVELPRVPEELAGTTLRAELMGVNATTGKAIPAHELGGILNASVPKAREIQAAKDVKLVPVAFDITRHRGKDVSQLSFRERHALVEASAKALGIPSAEVAMTAEEKEKMLTRIAAGQHPLTTEGVVLKPWEQRGAPTKVKFRPDHDVYVRAVFPALGKDGKPLDRAGGFLYSHSPTGPVVGRVGTGFDHGTARDMLKSPHLYVGRGAKVEAEKKFESGALSKPAFKEWHLDKGTYTGS